MESSTTIITKNDLNLIILLLVFNFIGTILELINLFDSQIKFIGVTGNLFYLYLQFIETFIFLISLVQGINQSGKYQSYLISGILLLTIGGVINLLTIVSHFLLSIPPINSPDYGNWMFLNDFSFVTLCLFFSLPYLHKLKKEYLN
jgi:hypothetical protein